MANGLKLAEIDQRLAATMQDTLGWQAQLRAEMVNSISADDLKEIVARQVQRAKEGDAAAIKFVMTQVLGMGTPVNIQQTNIVTDVESAARMARDARTA